MCNDVDKKKIKIIHVSKYDIFGGAGRAAYRIHRSLKNEHEININITSEMWVVSKLADDVSVVPINELIRKTLFDKLILKLYRRLLNILLKSFKTENAVIHSTALKDTGLGKLLNQSDADIVHIHWIGEDTISIREIGLLRKPVVWTLHDQWVFCGAEHYTILPPRVDQRYIYGYYINRRPKFEHGFPLNEIVWKSKLRSWKAPMSFVATSNWLLDCAKESVLLQNKNLTLIPYPLNVQVWKPVDKNVARKILNIKANLKVVLFGAIGGASDRRKGADYLFKALTILKDKNQDANYDLQLLIFGQSQFKGNDQLDKLEVPVYYLGHLHDDLSLRLAYSAADVMIVPSVLEAYGQTATEAHACGTPVVAFDIGGLSDIVDHKVTGALAKPHDPVSLANWIEWVIVDDSRNKQLGLNARAKAEKEWDSKKIAARYSKLYSSILS